MPAFAARSLQIKKTITPVEQANTRLPAGHPEGYLEGFANIYAEAARAIIARRDGVTVDSAVTFPGLKEGLEGVAFVDACVRSSSRNGAWVTLNL